MTNPQDKNTVKKLMEESMDPFYALKSTDMPEQAEVGENANNINGNQGPSNSSGPQLVDVSEVAHDASTSRFAEVKAAPEVQERVGSDDPNDDHFMPVRETLQEQMVEVKAERAGDDEALTILRKAGMRDVSPSKRNWVRQAGSLAAVLGIMWGVKSAVPELAKRQANGQRHTNAAAAAKNEEVGWQKFYNISQAAIKPAQTIKRTQAAKGARDGAWVVLNSLFSQVSDREAKLAFYSSAVQLAMTEGNINKLAALYSKGHAWSQSNQDVKEDYRLAATMQAAASRLSHLTNSKNGRLAQTSQNWDQRAKEWQSIAAEQKRTVVGLGWQAQTQEEVKAALAKAEETPIVRSKSANWKEWKQGYDRPLREVGKAYQKNVSGPSQIARN